MLKWEQAIEDILKYKLEVRDEFWCCNPVVFEGVVNGCGPAGIGDLVIPDRHLGVFVKPACVLHDFEYNVGIDYADKLAADQRFRRNMQKIDRYHSNWLTYAARNALCWWYYRAVRRLGNAAFIDKTNREELLETCE